MILNSRPAGKSTVTVASKCTPVRPIMIPGELFPETGDIELNAGRGNGEGGRFEHRRSPRAGGVSFSLL